MPIDGTAVQSLNASMDAATGQVVTAVAACISTIAVAYIGFKMKKLEHSMNSMREELVSTTASASKAEGKLAGREELKAEQDAKTGI